MKNKMGRNPFQKDASPAEAAPPKLEKASEALRKSASRPARPQKKRGPRVSGFERAAANWIANGLLFAISGYCLLGRRLRFF